MSNRDMQFTKVVHDLRQDDEILTTKLLVERFIQQQLEDQDGIKPMVRSKVATFIDNSTS